MKEIDITKNIEVKEYFKIHEYYENKFGRNRFYSFDASRIISLNYMLQNQEDQI